MASYREPVSSNGREGEESLFFLKGNCYVQWERRGVVGFLQGHFGKFSKECRTVQVFSMRTEYQLCTPVMRDTNIHILTLFMRIQARENAVQCTPYTVCTVHSVRYPVPNQLPTVVRIAQVQRSPPLARSIFLT